MFVEYNIQGQNTFKRFSHSCFQWHKRKISALTTGVPFDERKPAKNVEEFWDNTVDKGKKYTKEVVDEVKSIDTGKIKEGFRGFWNKVKDKVAKKDPPA